MGMLISPSGICEIPEHVPTAHAFLSQVCFRFPCVSPQIGGQLYDLCTIITPCSYFYKPETEENQQIFVRIYTYLSVKTKK